MLLLRSGGNSGNADLWRVLLSLESADRGRFVGMEPVLERCADFCCNSSACSSSFSVNSFASAFSSANATVQLLVRIFIGLTVPLGGVDMGLRPLGVGGEASAPSVFQVGDLREPCAMATAGVPLPMLLTLSLGPRSGELALELA